MSRPSSKQCRRLQEALVSTHRAGGTSAEVSGHECFLRRPSRSCPAPARERRVAVFRTHYGVASFLKTVWSALEVFGLDTSASRRTPVHAQHLRVEERESELDS